MNGSRQYADRCSEIMGGLEKSMEPVEEAYYILCFDTYGNPFLFLEDEDAPLLVRKAAGSTLRNQFQPVLII